jgi:hypothetical protein
VLKCRIGKEKRRIASKSVCCVAQQLAISLQFADPLIFKKDSNICDPRVNATEFAVYVSKIFTTHDDCSTLPEEEAIRCSLACLL